MDTKGTLLYVYRDQTHLEGRKLLLEGNGYSVLTAFPGQEALALLVSGPVDVVVLESTHDSAKEMKRVNPKVPVLLVSNSLDIPDLAVDSIDALVAKFDGDQFLLDTLHFLLEVKPSQIYQDGANRRQRSQRQPLGTALSAWKASIARTAIPSESGDDTRNNAGGKSKAFSRAA